MDRLDLVNGVRARRPVGSILPFSCLELFQPIVDSSGAEVAGMTIPEHGRIRIPVQTAQMGGFEIAGIERLPQLTAARASPASAARS